MNFNTRSVAVPAAQSGSKYLSVGINDGVTITGISSGESSKKATPFIAVTYSKGDDSTFDAPFYMSDAAQEISLQKLLHIFVDGLGVDKEEVDKVGDVAKSLDDYAKRLNALVPKGNLVRQKFAGEEYTKQDGSIGTRKVVGYVPFIEPAATTPSKLTYNEKNKSDLKRLPAPDPDMAIAAGAKADDGNDLPF